MLRSWRDVTVATIILLLSQLLQHIKPLSSQQNDFFCREIKGDASAEGIPVVVVLQGLSLSLLLSLSYTLSERALRSDFFSEAAPS